MGAPSDGGLGVRHISVIFEVLPTSIQAIIPPLPSLRRTVSQRKAKVSSFLPGALFVLQPSAPIPTGTLDTERPLDDVRLIVEEDLDSAASESSSVSDPRDNLHYRNMGARPELPTPDMSGYPKTPGPRPEASRKGSFPFLRRAQKATPPPLGEGLRSSIDRKFQRKGEELLRDSDAEGHPSNPDPNPAFERRAYIDGVAYLLQGLPEDLNEMETSIVRSALPVPLLRELSQRHQRLPSTDSDLSSMRSLSPTRGSLVHHQGAGAGTQVLGGRRNGPSPVHRVVQTVITTLIFLMRLVMSALITTVQEVVRVGNEYQIPGRVTRQTMFMASSFASIGTSAASTIGSVSKASYALVDDRVGNGLGAILQWFADEAIAGLCDGVRDGLRCQVDEVNHNQANQAGPRIMSPAGKR